MPIASVMSLRIRSYREYERLPISAHDLDGADCSSCYEEKLRLANFDSVEYIESSISKFDRVKSAR